MVFIAKLHRFFQHLALFSQNLINTNNIEMGDNTFDTKNVSIVVKLTSKFFSKMQEHIDDNSIPKDVLSFARSFFTKATCGVFVNAPKDNNTEKQSITQPTTDGNVGGKRKPNGEEEGKGEKPKKEFSNRAQK